MTSFGREVWYPSTDGLKLFARVAGEGSAGTMPVLCLPGLTRNSLDFETIAPRLAGTRLVLCPDFRGRGLSAHADPSTYRPDVELSDTLALLDVCGVRRAAVIGTSRGGIVAMLMALKAKDRLAGVCFNDIGPRIMKAGLLRIRSYLGVNIRFSDWEEATWALKATNPGLEGISDDAWDAFARRIFREGHDGLRADYDLRLAATFPSEEDIETGKVPELWGLFDQIAPLPALVIQGAASDLLDDATIAEMQAHMPALAVTRIAQRGHVPFLDEPDAVAAIDRWLVQVDGNSNPRS